MTVKELMEQVDPDRVTEAYILVDYFFQSDCYELTVSEKFGLIPKIRKIISDNMEAFRECTPEVTTEEYTIFIMYDLDNEDFENREKKSLSCYAICDEEAYAVLDKDFFLHSDGGEDELGCYSFDHEPVSNIAAHNIAKSSIDTLGMEICAAKILSDIFFWGFYPERREERVAEFDKKIEEACDERKYISGEEVDKRMEKMDAEIRQAMTEDERAYYTAKERFETETKGIVRLYWEKTNLEREKQHMAAIKEEYRGRIC